jgi:hypothetical protein
MTCWTVWQATHLAARSGATAARHPIHTHHLVGKVVRAAMRHNWNISHTAARVVWKASVACAGLGVAGGAGIAGWQYVPPVAGAAWGALGPVLTECCSVGGGVAPGAEAASIPVSPWTPTSATSGSAPVRVPEPSGAVVLGSALIVMAATRWRKAT